MTLRQSLLRSFPVCGNRACLVTIIRGVKRLVRKGCLVTLAAVLLLILSPVLWRNIVKLYYHPSIYAPPEVPEKSVAVVFGAAVYANGRLSPVLRDRVDTAIDLYKSGRVERIIVSGDNLSVHYDEPGSMMAYAIAQGVAPADIIADRAGQRTYDTCYRAGYVFDVTDAILVTQKFHLPRALMICEGLGIDAIGAVADQRPYRGARWYEVRETAATVVALWDVLRRNPPSLLVDIEEAEASSRPTLLAGRD